MKQDTTLTSRSRCLRLAWESEGQWHCTEPATPRAILHEAQGLRLVHGDDTATHLLVRDQWVIAHTVAFPDWWETGFPPLGREDEPALPVDLRSASGICAALEALIQRRWISVRLEDRKVVAAEARA